MGETWRYLVCARGKMTGLWTCVVFSCTVSLVFGVTSVRDDANWFKNGQRIKNRFVTGVVNGIVDFHCNDTVNGDSVEGECLSKVECTKLGGQVGGLCSLLGSCCLIERTCRQSTSSKLSYFVPPKKFETDCPLTVNIYSKDVCQIRLDFERFDIAQPTNENLTAEDGNVTLSSYQCHHDSFHVENVKKNLGFPHLCGKNAGQHIYIPVAENQQQIILRFILRERNGTTWNLTQPDWRIKIRQLECRRSGYDHLLNAPSKLMTMYNNLKNKKHPKSDYELIAPPNCLQYYPKKTGTFESFNYNGGKGCYIGRLNYAICFRKTPEICGARYTADGVFQMNKNKYTGENDKEDQCHPTKPASSTVSQDYIWIPGGVDSLKHFRDYYCNKDFYNNSVTTKSYGPLYVGVRTDNYRANADASIPEEIDEFAEVGFRIRYELNSGSCDTHF